ncbi:ATP-binding protein [Streptomyces sp. NPDC008001]|uniref:ATP-binding protein n=1 Tax=Streptomyces sp. NPDC008001 TaxID=3364804 RepID=UPI0036E6589B
MSLPLTRRIARAALLVAAGAAPVIGAAGAASAAPQAPDLTSGLTAVDGANLGSNVDAAAHKAGDTVTGVGTSAIKTTVPGAADATGKAAKTAAPAVQKVAGEAAGTTGGLAGEATKTAGGLNAKGLPLGGGQLPIGG